MSKYTYICWEFIYQNRYAKCVGCAKGRRKNMLEFDRSKYNEYILKCRNDRVEQIINMLEEVIKKYSRQMNIDITLIKRQVRLYLPLIGTDENNVDYIWRQLLPLINRRITSYQNRYKAYYLLSGTEKVLGRKTKISKKENKIYICYEDKTERLEVEIKEVEYEQI